MSEEVLAGRKHIVIRAIGDTAVSLPSNRLPGILFDCPLLLRELFDGIDELLHLQDEKGIDAQKRLIKELYETVEDVEPA